MDFNKVIEKILKYSSYVFIAWGFICFFIGIVALIIGCFTNYYECQFGTSIPFITSGICYLWGAYNYLCYRIMKVCDIYIYKNEVLPPLEAQDPTNDV